MMQGHSQKTIYFPSLIWLLLLFHLSGCATEDFRRDSSEVGHADSEESHPVRRNGLVKLDGETLKSADIQTQYPEIRKVSEFFETTAVVSANESRLAHVRPLSEGIIREVHVEKGERVPSGHTLLVYDNIELGELIGRIQGLQARLRRSLAQKEVSFKLWERGRRLYDAEAISEKEFDLRQSEYRNAQEAVRAYQAEIAGVTQKLRRFGLSHDEISQIRAEKDQLFPERASLTRLQAPLAGTIIDYDAARGEVVSPDRTLLTIADLSSLWVLADIYESDLARVVVGQRAEVLTNSYPDRVFPAKVTYIGDVLDPRTRTVKLRCVVANPDGLLKLGMFATVRIHQDNLREVLTIPSSAVQFINDRSLVFVQLEETLFETRVVSTGIARSGWITIEEGLKEGERVVTKGGFSLKSELMREALGGGHAH